jgi:ferredoxin
MAHKISDACVSCGACVSDCPLEAIEEKDGQYVIDADKCTDCGACVGSCPTEAISA